MSTVSNHTYTCESSFSPSILVYPTSSPEPHPTPKIEMDPSNKLACVICYLEEGQEPEIFYIEQKDGWISFLDDEHFVQTTQFFETKFDIFHNQIGEFLELSPDAVEWRYLSAKYSFFLLKKQCLSEDQCPRIGEWCLLLMTDIDDYIKERASSPLPPSSPPPDTHIPEHRDMSIQTDQPALQGISSRPGIRGLKRRYSELLEEDAKGPLVNIHIQLVVEGSKASVELDQTEEPRKKRKRSKRAKRDRRRHAHLGTGTHDDPIDVNAF